MHHKEAEKKLSLLQKLQPPDGKHDRLTWVITAGEEGSAAGDQNHPEHHWYRPRNTIDVRCANIDPLTSSVILTSQLLILYIHSADNK